MSEENAERFTPPGGGIFDMPVMDPALGGVHKANAADAKSRAAD